ncbi:tape measure protein [Flavobacterium sp. CBA20B-1]|uniref:tape measure protein n=1 Tax=unclassified Flavobacterium TaxID=196869 RepID=UPI00222457D1|nr:MULTISPECIES: tape measure protein [unclassified Flavobacterium]WCM42406.1 tape measure protein [Flavobacterium sp. CBA20B-1]
MIKTQREESRLKRELINLENAENNQKKKNKVVTMEERVQQQLANKADKEAVLAKMGLIGPYQKLNRQRTEAKKKLLDLIAAGNASNKQLRQAQREFDVLDKKIRRADQAAGDFTKNVGNYKSAFAGVSNILGAFGIVGGLTGLVALGKSIYETTKLIQGQEIALKMLSETEETYAKNKEFLVRISEQYGLELITTTNAYKNYYASAKTAIQEGRLSFEEMQTIFEKISKSSSMLGLSVDQQEGAFLAISQMMSKGTVQSEELRGQLGERLPGAFEVMAKALNVTTMELGEMLKKGEVMAADVLPRFAVAYEKAIGANQVERVETLAAAQNRASNKWTEFVENLNNGKGTITEVGIGFFEMTSKILDLIGAKEQLSKTIQNEQLELNMLIGRITSANVSNAERLSLIEKLKKNYPDFISFIQDEDYSNKNLIETLNQVNDNYKERIRLQIIAEEKQDRLKGIEAATRSVIVAEDNLFEKLVELNLKYNLGLNVTRDNLNETAKKMRELGKENKALQFDSRGVNRFEKDILRLTENLNHLKNLYDKFNEENPITFTALEKIPESRRQYLEDEWDKEQAEKRAAEKKKLEEAQAKETEEQKKKREAAERKARAAREKAQREAEKAEQDRLKKQKELYEAEIDLAIWRTESKAEILKDESINEKNTQEERYNALMESQQLEESALRLNLEKKLTLSRAFQKRTDEFTKQEIQDLIDRKEIKNQLSNEELLILEKFYAAQEKLRKDNEKDLKDSVEFEANLLKKQAQEKVKKITSQNNKDEAGEINALSIGSNLTDVENYEKSVYKIKRKYLLKNLEDELAVYNTIVESEKKKGKVNQDILDKQLELENQVREFKNESHVESLEQTEEIAQRYKKLAEDIKIALIDLTNAIFDNRIQRIDEDIERTDDKYEREYELAEGNEQEQERIRIRQEKEREKLEAKKRKEQHKQAVFNKTMAIADIGISTAKAIMSIWAEVPKADFGITATKLSIMAGILGAIQTAAVLATPIPKYKMGREDGPEEIAIVGDGGVHEVIEHKDGSAEITPRRDTLVKLLEGDKVHSSIEKYRQSRRNQFKNDLVKDHLKMQAFINNQPILDNSTIERKLDELIKITKSKNMSVTVNTPKIDLAHAAWRAKQLGY